MGFLLPTRETLGPTDVSLGAVSVRCLDVWVQFWVLVWLLCLVAASFSCLLVGPFREMLGTTVGCLGAVLGGCCF